jgi:hypothetical protein
LVLRDIEPKRIGVLPANQVVRAAAPGKDVVPRAAIENRRELKPRPTTVASSVSLPVPPMRTFLPGAGALVKVSMDRKL